MSFLIWIYLVEALFLILFAMSDAVCRKIVLYRCMTNVNPMDRGGYWRLHKALGICWLVSFGAFFGIDLMVLYNYFQIGFWFGVGHFGLMLAWYCGISWLVYSLVWKPVYNSNRKKAFLKDYLRTV